MRPSVVSGIPVAFCESANLEDQRHEACGWAERWLNCRSKCSDRERWAAVFDIDATLLHGQNAIPSVIGLYNAVKELGITRFIVTARSEDGKAYTLNELSRHGIEHPRHLFMHPRSAPCRSSSEAGSAKERSRKRIEKKNFKIILNVGDAFHDHYTPPSHRDLHRGLGNDSCVVFLDPEDGCAHLKLVHP